MPAIQKLIPAKYAIVGLVGVVLVDSWLFSKIFSSSYNSTLKSTLSNVSYTVPLWTNATNVQNLDRVYFEIDDSQNNNVNVFHNGL